MKIRFNNTITEIKDESPEALKIMSGCEYKIENGELIVLDNLAKNIQTPEQMIGFIDSVKDLDGVKSVLKQFLEIIKQ